MIDDAQGTSLVVPGIVGVGAVVVLEGSVKLMAVSVGGSPAGTEPVTWHWWKSIASEGGGQDCYTMKPISNEFHRNSVDRPVGASDR